MRVSRGSWYSSCANSTWMRPSCVCALCAKMSRMMPLRSSTLTFEELFERALLLGRQLVVRHQHVEVRLRLGQLQLFGLAGAQVPERMDRVSVLGDPPHHFAPGRLDQGRQARPSDSSAVQPSSSPLSTAIEVRPLSLRRRCLQ